MASARKACLGLAALVAAGLLVMCSGCGLQTDEANQAMAKATKSQQEAEAVLARLRNFPAEWQAVFSLPYGPDQIARARQLLVDREADVETFTAALATWKADMKPILKLDVDDKIKEYVKLKIGSIVCYAEYAKDYLRPIFKAYGGLVEEIAYGRPQAELDRSASEITELVKESSAKLEECSATQKQAEDYFQESRIGK